MVSNQLTIQAEYKQTEIGIILEEWNVRSVKDSFEIWNTLRLPIKETNTL